MTEVRNEDGDLLGYVTPATKEEGGGFWALTPDKGCRTGINRAGWFGFESAVQAEEHIRTYWKPRK